MVAGNVTSTWPSGIERRDSRTIVGHPTGAIDMAFTSEDYSSHDDFIA
jgi:hypothetical protein